MTETTIINPMDIPGGLLEKYQRSGPRYTSYPTAPQFKTEFDTEAISKLWTETNDTDNGLSLYTHFPFCNTRCLYCGCLYLLFHVPVVLIDDAETVLLKLHKMLFLRLQEIDAPVDHDTLEPGTECDISLKLVYLLEGLDKSLLCDIFGIRRILDESHGYAIHPLGIFPV